MKICVISTNIMTCPPAGYSGLEMLAWQIAKGLGEKGHQVVLVAPQGSTATKNVELHETTLGEQEKHSYGGYKSRLPLFDCIIDHSWQKWSYVSRAQEGLKVPVLGVLHARVHTMYSSPPPVEKPCLVTISQDQATAVQELLHVSAETIYNGVDVDFYKPHVGLSEFGSKVYPQLATSSKRNDRYLFLARLSSIKGPHIAVAVAANCGVCLDLVGDDKITGEPDLVRMVKERCIVTPGLRYVGNQTRTECVHWFNRNKALLHPNETFREPFGLAPVEAQLCGMPVIAWDNGAMRETIKVGETGFLVKSQQEMEELVRNDAVSSIKPSRCREWASQFSYQKMIDRYESFCLKAVETGGW